MTVKRGYGFTVIFMHTGVHRKKNLHLDDDIKGNIMYIYNEYN